MDIIWVLALLMLYDDCHVSVVLILSVAALALYQLHANFPNYVHGSFLI